MTSFRPYRPYRRSLAGGGGAGRVATTVFSAFGYDPTDFELTGVQKGEGSLTEARSAVIQPEDYFGSYPIQPAGHVAYSGGRVVRNRLRDVSNPVTSSRDFSNAAAYRCTLNYAGGVVTASVTDAGAYFRMSTAAAVTGFPAGETVQWSIECQGVGATIGKQVQLYNFTAGALTSDLVTLTSGWKRITLKCPVPATGSQYWNVMLGAGGITAGEQVNFRNQQLEVVSAKANQNPSEYVPVGLVANDGFAVFAGTNGNTVTTSVVVETTGVQLADLPYAFHAPAAGNPITYSNDLTNAAWTATGATVAKNAAGIREFANDACTVTATAGNATVLRAAPTVQASGKHATVWALKRKTGTGAIELTLDNGTTWQDITSQVASGGYALVAVDQTATDPQIGVRIITSGDAIYVANTGLSANTPKELAAVLPPIFTTTALVSRDACAIALPDGAWANDRGSFRCDLLLTAPPSGTINVLGDLLTYDGTTLTLTDGAHSSALAVAPGAHRVGGVWGAQLRLLVEGTWGAAVAYTPWAVTALPIFDAATTVGGIRDLELADIASESWVVDAVTPDNLMGAVLGDSTAAAYVGYIAVADYVPSALDREYGRTITSLADPGDTVAQQKTAWIADANKAQYDWIIVQIGLNDVGYTLPDATIIGRVQDLVDQINTDKKAGAKLIIATMTPAHQRWIDLFGAVNGPTAHAQWAAVNEAIKGNGATPVTWVDSRLSAHTDALGDVDGYLLPAYDHGDHIHENNPGRQVIAAVWHSGLVSLGLANA